MTGRELNGEDVTAARQMYDDGATLGEISRVLRCSVYDLSPWLYMEHPSIRDAIAALEETNKS